MNAAVGLMDGLGLDGDRCISVIPRQYSRPLVKLIQEKIVKSLKVALNRFPVPLWHVCERVGGID